MTSFSRYAPGFREVGEPEGGSRPGMGERTGAGGRAGRGRDGQHLGQLHARGPGLWFGAGCALPPQCTAAPAGGGDPSGLSSSLVPAPAQRSAAEGAGRFYRFHPSRKDGRGSQRER